MFKRIQWKEMNEWMDWWMIGQTKSKKIDKIFAG